MIQLFRDKQTKMRLYIDKLAELMQDEPQTDSLITEPEESQKKLTPEL